jgi:4-hydroxy-tetrahydrodipicolinate synthase
MQLWDAVQSSNHLEARRLHEMLLRIWNSIVADNLPANVRYCMELQGRPAGVPRPPMPESSAAQQVHIHAALDAAGLIRKGDERLTAT